MLRSFIFLAAQTQLRMHRAGADKDKSLAGNSYSGRKKASFVLYLSL